MKKNYFIGLDIGTNSIGWAVTDTEYNILKFNGKAMWGIHLFEPGKTAEERRMFRSARRRRARAVERKMTLRSLFESEINKIDTDFFKRLDDSFFWAEDKSINQKNTLFNDSDFSDKEYHTLYPTIYHLRNALIENKDKKFDIRLIYLAIEHILKHRGHFLYGGSDMETAMNFNDIYSDWCAAAYDITGEDLLLTNPHELSEILKESAGVNSKKKALKSLFGNKAKSYIELLSGASVAISKLFGEQYADGDIKSVCFKGDTFDTDKDTLLGVIGEDNLHFLEKTKSLYDWGVLAEILKGNKYLSKAKMSVYEKHKDDLVKLKSVILSYSYKLYNDVFKSENIKGNYASYIGMTKKNGKKMPLKGCTTDEFYKYIKKILTPFKEDSVVTEILSEIEMGTFLPKQVTKDNSVIPYQVHLAELKAILKNSSAHYEFLSESDKYGTVAEKIESLLTFRIPYYIGPLNPYHNKYSWIIRTQGEKVYPWNFDELIDSEKSAEAFITRMTNYCTYIPDEPVLAKSSVLYSKYMVFNELSNIRVNETKLTPLAKTEIYNTIYLRKSQPKLKDIKDFIKNQTGEDCEITGVNEELKANMKSLIDFKKIIGDKAADEQMVDEIIRLITILGDEKEMLANRIKELYGDILTEQEIRKISALKYSGWGSFSRKLLTEVRSELDNSCIMDLLMNSDENFMQIIFNESYGIGAQLEAYKTEKLSKSGIGTYSSLKELYVSPSNRKRIWRVMVIMKELVKVMKCEPQKIFIEMARGTDEIQNKSSRKKQLTELYKSIKTEKELTDALMNETESTLRQKKLYLYYRQMRRCMYSGKVLSPSDLDLCDIDHIIPRSKKDDDSLDNTVLVFKDLNAKKSDIYPIPDSIVSDAARNHWELLKSKGFITKEKYNRLTRKNPLTVDELADFVERQLVETRQVTKVVAEIFNNLYKSSEIVYVKAKNVSSFRNGGYLTKDEAGSGEYKDESLVKVREINDFHHAKDAYLNIVVGNIYNEKFNHNPKFYIKNGGYYHLGRLCEKDVPAANWVSGHDGTIVKIKSVLAKNNILYTVMPYEQRGGFFDQMPVEGRKGLFPLKTSDERYNNVDRYGGYNKVSGAYLAIVESTVKGKRVKTIESVPVYIADKIKSDPDELVKYFESKGMSDIKILLPELRFGTLLKINGAFVHITGRTNDSYVLCNRAQLCVDTDTEKYIKKLVKYNDSLIKDPSSALNEDHNGLNISDNTALYDFFIEKLKTNVYKEFLSAQIKNLEDGKEKFIALPLGEQNKVLYQALKIFQCNRTTADLSSLGKTKDAGIMQKTKKLNKTDKIIIINQSPAGLFETCVDISEL